MSARFKAGAVGVAGVVIVIILAAIFGVVTVDEGHVAVEKNKGAATGEVYEPGWHLQNPITYSAAEIETRPQVDNHKEVYAITEDGQDVWIDITVRYRVQNDEAVTFYSEYESHKKAQERVIQPTVRSTIRDEVGDTSARDIITKEERQRLQGSLEENLNENVEGSGVTVEAAQIRNVKLNDQYASALENVEIEETAAERKQIEAEADRDAYQTRTEGLSDEVLMEQYIASIDESDTVILATGEDGAPIMLDASELGEEQEQNMGEQLQDENLEQEEEENNDG